VCGFGTFLRLESALKSIELRSCATDATTAPHPAGMCDSSRLKRD